MRIVRFALMRIVFLLITLSLGLLLGCKARVIEIPEPTPSKWTYMVKIPHVNLAIIDARKDSDKNLSTGVIASDIKVEDKSFEPFRFLKNAVEAEMTARGFIPRIFTQAANKLYVKKFNVHTVREGPYAPFTVWIGLQGEFLKDGKTYPINALVVNQHYPKFTYSELDKPLYGDALERLVKEVTAKMARELRPDAQVGNLTIEQYSDNLNLNKPNLNTVFELGFSNNPMAVPILVELLQNKKEEVRRAATYGIGVLQAKEYLPMLTAMYEKSDDYIEKVDLLKSVLDMQRPRATKWVEKELNKIKYPESDDPLGLLKRTAELYGLELKAKKD